MKEFIVYINGTSIDLYNPYDLDLAITLSISDANNLQERKAGNTKTFKVPASGLNKRTFGHPHDINSVVNIDQSTRPDVLITRGGTKVFRGYVKVNGSIEDDGKKVLEYDLVCIGDNGAWINKMSGKNINTLNYADQDHINTSLVVEASETILAGREYVYDLADRGKFKGFDYGTPAKDSVSIIDRFPAISMRSLLERSINDTGFKIVSAFKDADFFSRCYWPFSNDKLLHPPTFNATLPARIESLSTDIIYSPSATATSVSLRCTFSAFAVVSDPSNSWEHKTVGYHFIKATGRYKVRFIPRFSFRTFGDPLYPSDNGTIVVTVMKFNKFKIGASPVPAASDASATYVMPYGSPSSLAASLTIEREWNLEFGDELYLNADMYYNAGPGTIYFKWETSVRIEVLEAIGPLGMGEYQQVRMNYNLPDCPRLDFIQALKDCFNLMFFTDLESRTIYVESWDEFYTTDVENWTQFLDNDKEIRIKFTGAELSKNILYKYKEDSSDRVVSEYNKVAEYPFGSSNELMTNVFTKDNTTIIENKVFAATWMELCKRIGFNNQMLPKMWTDTSLPPPSTKFMPRIWYYAGVQSLTGGDTWRMNQFGDYDNQLFNPIGDHRNKYPSFYTYNNEAVNDNSLQYNDEFNSSGLQQKHFRNRQKGIDEGKQYDVNINLTDVMVSNISFRRPKLIENPVGNSTYFILDKVDNFRPQDNESTPCYFTKILIKPKKRALPSAGGGTAVPYVPIEAKTAIALSEDGRTVMISGEPAFRMSSGGRMVSGEGSVYVEDAEGNISPVFIEDEFGNYEEVENS